MHPDVYSQCHYFYFDLRSKCKGWREIEVNVRIEEMTPLNLTHSDVCLIKIYNKKLKTIRVPCKNTHRFQ